MLRRDRCDQRGSANPETRDPHAARIPRIKRLLADFFAFVN
jgi:hypothetical protein